MNHAKSCPKPASGPANSKLTETGRPKKRRRGWLIALLLILLLGGGAFAGWWFWNEAEQRRIEENQIDVPDVSGMPETEAQNALTTAGLRPILEYDHSDEIERDHAIGTEPSSGTTMERYDEITPKHLAGPRPGRDPRLAPRRFEASRTRYLGRSLDLLFQTCHL